MELKECIDDICKKLKEGVFRKEAEVSTGIVLRLLHVLEWDRDNPQFVKPEYAVKNQRVDFALCHLPDNPIVFIEVKQVGNLSGAEEQLFNYAFHEGIPIAILTDGQHWHFFYPIGKGNYENRKVCELDLLNSDSEESVKCISRYLSYDAIQSGDAVRAIESDYQNVVKQKQIEKRLPEAWRRLLQDEDELLIEVMVDKTKILCKEEPTKEQVLTFLKSLEKKSEHPPIVPTSSISPTVVVPQSQKPQQRIRVTMDGTLLFDHQNAQQTFRETLEIIGLERVMSVNKTAVSNEDFVHNRFERVGEFRISKNHGSAGKKWHLDKIAKSLGIDLDVELVDK